MTKYSYYYILHINNLRYFMDEKEKDVETEAPEVEAEIVEPKKSSGDVEVDSEMTKKIIFSLCYLWGILFFIPLLMYKGDAKATRHANEGLLLLLFSVIGNIVLGGLSSISWIFGMLAGLYSLAILVLGIIGIVYIVTDQDKELPLIGKIKILK